MIVNNAKLESSFIVFSSLITAGTAFFNPVLYIFLVTRDFSYSEIGLYLSVFWLAIFLSELPTGIIADIIGQKKAMIISSLLRAVGLILLLSGSFVLLLLSAILTGVAESLVSGTLSSWLMNQSSDKKGLDLDKIFSKAAYIGSFLSLIIGFFTAQIIYQFNNFIPIIGSSIFFLLLSVLIYFFLPEVKIKQEKKEHSNSGLITIIKEIKGLVVKNSYMLILLCLLVVPSILDIGPSNQWQVAFNDEHFIVGYIWVLISLIGIITNIFIPRIPKISSFKKEFSLYFLLDVLLVLAIVYLPFKLLFFLLHISVFIILNLKINVYLQRDFIKDDKIRSSVMSIFYTLESFVTMVLLLVNGFFTDSIGLYNTWALFVVISVILLSLLGVYLKRSKVRTVK